MPPTVVVLASVSREGPAPLPSPRSGDDLHHAVSLLGSLSHVETSEGSITEQAKALSCQLGMGRDQMVRASGPVACPLISY